MIDVYVRVRECWGWLGRFAEEAEFLACCIPDDFEPVDDDRFPVDLDCKNLHFADPETGKYPSYHVVSGNHWYYLWIFLGTAIKYGDDEVKKDLIQLARRRALNNGGNGYFLLNRAGELVVSRSPLE